MIDNDAILLTLLYLVDRLIDKLADVNSQSSVGMFSFHDVSHYSCSTVCTRLLVYIISVILSFVTYDNSYLSRDRNRLSGQNILMISVDHSHFYTMSQKNKQNYFCHNYVKLPPNLTIFGTMMANCLKLYEVHSFSTSFNSLQRRCSKLLHNAVIISLQ